MKDEYLYDRRKLPAVCTVLFLSPALRLVPGRSAELAGTGAWVSVIAALPVLLLYSLFLRRFAGKRGESEGIDELILRYLGERAGIFVLILLSAWLSLYCAFMLRSGAERMISTIYTKASPPFFIIIMALLGLAAALGAEKAIVRCAKLILPVVLGVILPVLAVALFHTDRANLLPLTAYEVLYSLKATGVTIDVMVLPMYLSVFLGGGRDDRGRSLGSLGFWAVGMVVLLLWMQVCIIGTFGAELTAGLSQPFFVLVRNLVLLRSLERVEALIVSLWVFSDFILSSVCLSISQRLLRRCMGKSCDYKGEKLLDIKNGRWVIWLCAALAALIAVVIAPDRTILELWSEKLIPYINLSVAFVLLPLIWLVGKLRKRA